MENNEIISIVGGGISGLYFCYNFLKKNKNTFINVYEKSNYLGGRIKTTKEEKTNNILFENGPWRFHKSHILLKKLLKELNIEYKILNSSHSNSININLSRNNKKGNEKLETFNPNNFLSSWENFILSRSDITEADNNEYLNRLRKWYS